MHVIGWWMTIYDGWKLSSFGLKIGFQLQDGKPVVMVSDLQLLEINGWLGFLKSLANSSVLGSVGGSSVLKSVGDCNVLEWINDSGVLEFVVNSSFVPILTKCYNWISIVFPFGEFSVGFSFEKILVIFLCGDPFIASLPPLFELPIL